MLSNHKAKVNHAWPWFKYCREDVPASTMTSLSLFKHLKPEPRTIRETSQVPTSTMTLLKLVKVKKYDPLRNCNMDSDALRYSK